MPRLTVRPEAELDALDAARWYEGERARDDVDHHAKTWTIPAERIKAGREHRVPLTARPSNC
jgi:hypothetical protein